jgi:UDP-N-acetylglucosamine acyltransferase
MTRDIHPTALVDPKASLGSNLRIGPYCVIGPDVVIEDDCELLGHVVMAGHTTLGSGSRVFPFAALGHEPQHLKYANEPSTLTIGKRCLIREGATAHTGTAGGGMKTLIGDGCVLMAHAHVAHDCELGSNIILMNNVMLAGHCKVGDFAILSGAVAVHQFCRIGPHAFVSGLSGVAEDIIPYGMANGRHARLAGLNIVGLRRRGFSREAIHELRRAYRSLFADEGTLMERLEDVAEEFKGHPLVEEIVAFIRAGGERSICTPRHAPED